MVLTVTLASINVCHLRTSERSLSEVKSSPWKLVRQFLPWTSSTLNLILRNAWSSSFCRSARETSKIRPLRASLAFLRPVVRLTRVFPTLSIPSPRQPCPVFFLVSPSLHNNFPPACIQGRWESHSLIWKVDGAWY